MTGFIQSDIMASMLNDVDVDGFNDRQLVAYPPEVFYMYDDYIPLSDSTPTFFALFKAIYDQHRNYVEYRLNEEALKSFANFHDELVLRKKADGTNQSQLGILSKAAGQTARLAGALHALHLAMQVVTDEDAGESLWSSEIDSVTTQRACTLMNYFINVKFELLSRFESGSVSSANPLPADLMPSWDRLVMEQPELEGQQLVVKKFLEFSKDGILKTDVVCRNRLTPAG